MAKKRTADLKKKGVVVSQPEPEPVVVEPEPEPEPVANKRTKGLKEKVKKEKPEKPKPEKKKKKKVKVVEPEPEFVEEVIELTIDNPKSKKHGKKIKRVVKQLKEQFEWLELDYNKVSDKDLEDIDIHAQKNPPESLGIDFMQQLLARGSTVETAKNKWSGVCRDMKTDKDLLGLMKEEEKKEEVVVQE
tara:strand:+ start:5318 stop:5884 length:567 start_codon:yes stop_codon:yes gene_type:complete